MKGPRLFGAGGAAVSRAGWYAPRRLLGSWSQKRAESGPDLLQDLDRYPWTEVTDEGIEVVFEGRPASRTWKDWMVSFTRWVDWAPNDVTHIAFVDRVDGLVRLVQDWGPEQSE
jgi:hypothetical protein